MPCAIAPITCPSTTAGLSTVPQSSTATMRSIRTWPVSASTSTTTAMQAFEYVSGGS